MGWGRVLLIWKTEEMMGICLLLCSTLAEGQPWYRAIISEVTVRRLTPHENEHDRIKAVHRSWASLERHYWINAFNHIKGWTPNGIDENGPTQVHPTLHFYLFYLFFSSYERANLKEGEGLLTVRGAVVLIQGPIGVRTLGILCPMSFNNFLHFSSNTQPSSVFLCVCAFVCARGYTHTPEPGWRAWVITISL